MKIVLPEHIGEVTLEQFQRYNKLTQRTDLNTLDFNKRKIEIFTGIKFQQVANMQQSDYEEIVNQIDLALTKDVPFVNVFMFKDIEYGFIPNFDLISVAELGDLREYGDKEDELHKTMAVLFRPVNGKDAFDNYTIEDYNGTATRSEMFKQLPLNIVNGALGFFLSLSNDLEIAIQRFTEEELAKVVTL
jgi:hypothetical protein